MDVLFGKAPKMHRDAQRPAPVRWRGLNTTVVDLHEAPATLSREGLADAESWARRAADAAVAASAQ